MKKTLLDMVLGVGSKEKLNRYSSPATVVIGPAFAQVEITLKTVIQSSFFIKQTKLLN
ncbi:hypothetical protein NOR53_1989 [gamma proteobacterium NOR5-3]|nr:hypothetical protein NOR53_1989 [gamma proteobacterium NOR5-3]